MEKEDIEEIVSEVFKKLDKSKLLEYGEIYVKSSEYGCAITANSGYSETPETFYIERNDYPNDDIRNVEYYVNVAKTIIHSLDTGISKHCRYHIECGVEDWQYDKDKKLMKILSKEQVEKLHSQGYTVIKSET